MSKQDEMSTMNNEQEARRKLLKMATYVPPAILGVMIAGNKIAEADTTLGQPKVCQGGGTIIVSANGNACCPCVSSSPDYNPQECAWKKCKLGNCAACPPGPYSKQDKCNKVAAACGCACNNPRNVGHGEGNNGEGNNGEGNNGEGNNESGQNRWVCK